MGLYIDIVKFPKVQYDPLRAEDDPRHVDALVGRACSPIVMMEYRKYYHVQTVLCDLLGTYHQCEYYELTRELLELAKHKAESKDWGRLEEMEVFVVDLNRILTETDFETEVIALSWVS